MPGTATIAWIGPDGGGGGGGGTVAFDNNGVAPYSGNGTQSTSFTTAGSNRYILIGTVGSRGPAVAPKYNGVSLSLLGSVTLSALVDVAIRLYGLIAPTSGANNVTVDYSGGTPDDFITFMASFKDVHQTTPVGTVVTNSIDAQTQSFSTAPLTLSAGQAAFAFMSTYNRTMTASSMTLLNTSNPAGATSGATGYKITTGSENCQFDWVGGDQLWGEISVPVLPA